MNYETNCEFSTPLQITTGGVLATPTTQNANFQFSQVACTTTNPMILEISNGSNSAYLVKSWDFGLLFISFLLVFGILFVIAEKVFFFCFDRFIAIIKTKKLPR